MTDDFTPLSQDELWLNHFSCVSWSETERWICFFSGVEEILGANITHLDKDDPVRRRVKPGKLAEVANYVASIGMREDSRWIFGKMEAIDIEFSVRHYRDVRGWPNSINWYFPAGFAENTTGAKAVRCLFDLGNATLSPFYAYADTKSHVTSKKKESGAINLQAELIGVFWLTYFNSKYVEFIGKDKFSESQDMHIRFVNGATLDLGEIPSSVNDGLRHHTEVLLGPKLFVEPKEMVTKRPGEYALSFEQLRTITLPSEPAPRPPRA